MAPVEFRELGPGDVRKLMEHLFGAQQVASRPAGPRGEVDYAANEDGPWPRMPDELDGQMYRLLDERAAIREAAGDEPSDEVLLREAYAEGVWAAANWTLGRRREAPLTQVPLVVNNAGLREEISVARAVIDADEGARGVAYARGVLAWFGWLAGARDGVPYPGREGS
jgi:hypothetical protein